MPFVRSRIARRALALAISSYVLASDASARTRRGDYIDVFRVDQHPPLVASPAGTDSLYGPVDASLRGDGIAESRRGDLEGLVRRFTPTMILPRGDFIWVKGRKIRCLPTNPMLFADTLRIDLVRAAPYELYEAKDVPWHDLKPESLVTLVDDALRYQSNASALVSFYFDFPGESPREWWRAYGALRTGRDSSKWSQPTVLAHPFLDGSRRLVIQYWFFYPFNDYLANHEGEWEHINVVPTPDRAAVEEVDYYFHQRSVRLPQRSYKPVVTDGTHPLVYVGGRGYNVLDYPVRWLAHERNEGPHGNYPFPGEWEGTGGLGAPESVQGENGDSTRVLRHEQFEVLLTPDPSRIDYRRRATALKEWTWLLLPVRWGFPTAPSLGSGLRSTNVGNRAPYGPAYDASWNRMAPGLLYPGYQVRRIPRLRGYAEDLLQPWYYLYAFRSPRYVHDTRGTLNRTELVRLGIAPRAGWGERGLGSTILGAHVGFPGKSQDATYGSSTSISVSRGLWAKVRFGAIEAVGGYQKFRRRDAKGSLFVYPFTMNLVARAPDALLRPYAMVGGGLYGWESRARVSADTQLVSSGWEVGWSAGAGVEYYLRTRLAFDVALRYHSTSRAEAADVDGKPFPRWLELWVGHYVRF